MARVVVLGRSGTGKSWYVGTLLEQVVPNFDHAIHFDLEDEETGLSDADHDPLYKTLYVTKERFDRGINLLRIVHRVGAVRVVPEGLTKAEYRELYGRCAAAAMALGKELERSCFVSCDEAHNVVPNGGDPDERVERMITGGRKHHVECLHISQRPQLLHKTCISQAEKRVYFQIIEENDINKLQNMTSFDANQLEHLGERRCIVENKNSGESKQVDTNEMTRIRPHHASDDGIVDEALPV